MFYNIAFLRNATNIWQKFLHTSRSYGTPLISLLLISTHIAFLRNEKSPNHHIIKSSHYQITKLSHHSIITSKSPLSPYKFSSFGKFFQCHGLNQLKILLNHQKVPWKFSLLQEFQMR